MKRKFIPVTIIIVQIAFLSSMILFHQVKINRATRIMLKTVPYDPLSIFRGRYVDLRYEISTLPVSLLKDVKPSELKSGDEFYVKLKKTDDYWQADGIYKERPRDKAIFIKGRLSNYYIYGLKNQKEIRLEYGIESFFMNERSADEIERANRFTGRNWQALERQRSELLSRQDTETQRIKKAGITQYWFSLLEKELNVWFNDGIIDQGIKDKISQRYAQSLAKLNAIENEVNNVGPEGQKPIFVEVAIDTNGYGYLTKLLFGGKIYK